MNIIIAFLCIKSAITAGDVHFSGFIGPSFGDVRLEVCLQLIMT